MDLGCTAMGVPTCPFVHVYPPVPWPGCCCAPTKSLREDLDETPVSPVQEAKWFGMVFGCCQQHRPQHTPLLTAPHQEWHGARCPFLMLLSPGATAGHRLFLCSAAVPAWPWFAFGSVLQFPAAPHRTAAGYSNSPCAAAPVGWGITALPSITRSGGEGQMRWSGCWSTRSSRPGCSHPARKRVEGGRVIAAVTHQLLPPNKRQRLHSQERARGQGQPG